MKVRVANIIALLINTSVVLMTIFGFFIQINLYQMSYKTIFRYYTTDSNILLGISALVMIPINLINIVKNENKTPTWASIFRLIAVTSTLITCITVFVFLNPTYAGGYLEGLKYLVLNNFGMLSYHFLNPLLGFISFAFFEGQRKFRKIDCFFASATIVIYAPIYTTMVLGIKHWPDFYGFNIVVNGFPLFWLVIILMLGISIGIGFLLILLNKKMEKHFRRNFVVS